MNSVFISLSLIKGAYQLAAFWLGIGDFSVVAGKMVIPAGFEPTACRLGVPKSVRL